LTSRAILFCLTALIGHCPISKNIGQVGDVSAILRAQAENDEDQWLQATPSSTASFWAIPVLGFIGTVLGLSLAIGRFTATLQAAGDLTLISCFAPRRHRLASLRLLNQHW